MTRAIRMGIAALFVVAGTLSAQSRPGQRVLADVRIHSAARHGDTTIVSYRIGLAANSPEPFLSFTLNTTGVPLGVSEPSGWMAGTDWRGRTVAQWVLLDSLAPGDSTPLLVMRGVGLPGTATGWIRGDAVPVLVDDTLADGVSLPLGDFDPLDAFAVQRTVVGIEAYPAASHFAYETRLKTLSGSACTLGWITNSGVCSNLSDLLTGPQEVLNHLAAVEAGYTAGHMNSLAYWMLKVNGEATRDLRDTQLVDLTYVCGNRFRISNTNYVSMTVTYRLYGTSGTDTATLAGRATDAAGPVETTIEMPSAGAVQLLYNGTVFRTKTNDAVTCP